VATIAMSDQETKTQNIFKQVETIEPEIVSDYRFDSNLAYSYISHSGEYFSNT
jgi:hypothetical protein